MAGLPRDDEEMDRLLVEEERVERWMGLACAEKESEKRGGRRG